MNKVNAAGSFPVDDSPAALSLAGRKQAPGG